MDDKVFKADAKQMVDTMFDSKMFKDDITRDQISGFEELIRYLMQSRFESYFKIEKFNQSLEKKKA
jgi:hypothetical protein